LDSLFLDNNIPIGFCFRQDPQHTFAKKLFNHSCSLNWSNNVEYEFNKVFDRKRNAYDDWIFDLITELNNIDSPLNKNDVINISIKLNLDSFDRKPLVKLIKDFWIESNLREYEPPSKIVPLLNKYKRSFTKKLLTDKKYCFRKIFSHTRRLTYPNIAQQLNIDGKDDLNFSGNDMNICLDAHDLGKTIPKLKFITDDNKILKEKISIENITKIYRILGINDYKFQ